MRVIVFLLTLVFALLSAVSAQAQKAKDEGSTQTLPPGNGRDLVLNSCNSSCHNLTMIVTARKNNDGWSKSVNDMIQRGATVFPEEIEPMTNYLSKFFGPGVHPPVNVNTASRDLLAKTTGLSQEMVALILEVRGKSGPFKGPEELRHALGIEREEFAKRFYLLKYED